MIPALDDAVKNKLAARVLVEQHRIIVISIRAFRMLSINSRTPQFQDEEASVPPNQAMPNQPFASAWFCPLLVHTLKNEGGTVSGQDALGVGLLPAFDLVDMGGERLGAAFVRLRIGVA